MERDDNPRRAKVSGMFYPAEPAALKRDIAALLERVGGTPAIGGVRGIIAPHAGYVYSGFTAAHAYGLLRGAAYETVVVVSPSHREYFDGISLYPGDSYETPLGVVPLDTALRECLVKESDIIRLSTAGHGEEHAIEVQLPFLQHMLSGFLLLPVVMGDQRREYCLELGRALGVAVRGRNALLVASTDLSHYHSSARAGRLDQIVMDDLARFDAGGLMTHLERGETEACGGGPTVAVMTALRALGVDHMMILHHCTSGDITGDHASVVGYLSAVACS